MSLKIYEEEAKTERHKREWRKQSEILQNMKSNKT